MSIPKSGRRYAPTIFGTVLTLVGLALFVWLGVCQLHRADEKQALLAQYAAGQQSTVDLTANNASSLPRYQQVRLSGHYDPEHQILLDNMPSQQGRAGYRVVTPFELEQGGWVLVDRGWVPIGQTRADLPEIPVGTEVRTLAGRLDLLPRAGVQLDTPDNPGGKWPRVMSFPQPVAVERALNRRLLKGVLLLDPVQPDGYERVWEAHFNFGPERHIGYAVQWFALAVAAVVIYLILGFRRSRTVTSESR